MWKGYSGIRIADLMFQEYCIRKVRKLGECRRDKYFRGAYLIFQASSKDILNIDCTALWGDRQLKIIMVKQDKTNWVDVSRKGKVFRLNNQIIKKEIRNCVANREKKLGWAS